MQALWNRIQLERPPNTTWRAKLQDIDAGFFKNIINQALRDLEAHDVFHKEAAILSRLIYRMKCKFRSDKSVKNMEKVNRALLNYLSLNLEQEYESLQSFIEWDGNFVILPSRQMLHYVLVRTQGFAKLMVHVEEVAECSAMYFKSRIGIGHTWLIGLVAYAVVSRIWLLSRKFVKLSCKWYEQLYPYQKILKVIGLPWIPEKYEFPNDLKLWLGVSWIDKKIEDAPNINYDTMFKLITLRGDDSDDNNSLVDDAENKEVSQAVQYLASLQKSDTLIENSSQHVSLPTHKDDLGEKIDRNTFAQRSVANVKNPQKVPNKKHKYKELNDNTEQDSSVASNFKKRKTITESKCEDSSLDKGKPHKTQKAKKPSLNVTKTPKKTKMEKSRLSDDSINVSNVIEILNKDSYPGLDKLQWNIIKNNSKNILRKFKKCSDEKKRIILFKKMIESLPGCIK